MIVRVDGIPAPKGSARAIKRGGFAVLVASSSDANKRAQRSWADAVAWSAKAERATPIVGPVVVNVEFLLPRPKSVKRASHTVKPDLDKILRCTLDALTGIAFADDSQVVRVVASKHYASATTGPGANIHITNYSEELP